MKSTEALRFSVLWPGLWLRKCFWQARGSSWCASMAKKHARHACGPLSYGEPTKMMVSVVQSMFETQFQTGAATGPPRNLRLWARFQTRRGQNSKQRPRRGLAMNRKNMFVHIYMNVSRYVCVHIYRISSTYAFRAASSWGVLTPGFTRKLTGYFPNSAGPPMIKGLVWILMCNMWDLWRAFSLQVYPTGEVCIPVLKTTPKQAVNFRCPHVPMVLRLEFGPLIWNRTGPIWRNCAAPGALALWPFSKGADASGSPNLVLETWKVYLDFLVGTLDPRARLVGARSSLASGRSVCWCWANCQPELFYGKLP